MTELEIEAMKKRFSDLCGSLNLNRDVEVSAWKQFVDTRQNYFLEGKPEDWMCCAIFTACNQTKLSTIAAEKVIVGNCISLAKLIANCDMDVYTFFKKMTTWCDVATLNPAISKKVQTIQRNFAATEVIYKKFAVNFKKMFLCPDVDEGKAASKSSRKAKALPCTPQKVFEFCWILFVTVKADHPTEKPDLVLFMCLLYCCLDLIYANAIFDKRRDLVNLDYKGFPKDTFMDPSNDEVVCIINKLCDENETDIATEDRAYIWKPIIKKFFNDQILAGNEENFMQLITIDNFDNNFKKVNDLYERYILSCGEFDERIFLKHFKMGSKYYGGPTDDVEKSYSTNDSAGKLPTRRLLDETPLTGQRLVGSQGDSYKMTPLTCVEDNVRKLRTIKNPSRDPQPSLYKLLVTQGPEEIILDLRSRLDKMMAIFCKEYLSNSTEHFKLAEALYYHFLESMIRTEMQKNINFNIFIKDELLNKSLIVLCMEIVLYGFSRQKDFPRILDIFDLDPFHFYKLIEISIRNNTSLLTRDMIKHLTSIEEQCLDSLAWRRGSIIWKIVEEHNEPLPQYQDVDSGASTNGNVLATPGSSNQQNGNTKSFRSLKLFFRKFYQLANVRIKHICGLLQLHDEQMLKEVWTIFEHAIIHHVNLMQDRHLDQIWMCCIYVLCKIRPSDFKFNFADIMRYYRNQPQAGSHIYRSVFIEYVENESEFVEQQKSQTNQGPVHPNDLRGNGVLHGKESRGDIIHFYNKVFVPKLQEFALKFGSGVPRNDILLSPMPPDRVQNISPKKISLYHDVFISPFLKQDQRNLGNAFTFVFDKSPSKDLIKLNSLIHQTCISKVKVSKRLNIDEKSVENQHTAKLPKLQTLISDRQNFN